MGAIMTRQLVPSLKSHGIALTLCCWSLFFSIENCAAAPVENSPQACVIDFANALEFIGAIPLREQILEIGLATEMAIRLIIVECVPGGDPESLAMVFAERWKLASEDHAELLVVYEVCHGRVGCFSNKPAKEKLAPSKLDELVHKHFDPAKAEIFPYSRFSGFFSDLQSELKKKGTEGCQDRRIVQEGGGLSRIQIASEFGRPAVPDHLMLSVEVRSVEFPFEELNKSTNDLGDEIRSGAQAMLKKGGFTVVSEKDAHDLPGRPRLRIEITFLFGHGLCGYTTRLALEEEVRSVRNPDEVIRAITWERIRPDYSGYGGEVGPTEGVQAEIAKFIAEHKKQSGTVKK
jgi:hypothetical protein